MIVIEEEKDLVTIHVYSELTLSDFREFEEVVTDELKRYKQVDLLFDLSSMTGFTLDVAWEDIQFNKQHVRDFNRIAVVTDSQWMSWLSWLSGVFVKAHVQTFPDTDSANTWLHRG